MTSNLRAQGERLDRPNRQCDLDNLKLKGWWRTALEGGARLHTNTLGLFIEIISGDFQLCRLRFRTRMAKQYEFCTHRDGQEKVNSLYELIQEQHKSNKRGDFPEMADWRFQPSRILAGSKVRLIRDQ